MRIATPARAVGAVAAVVALGIGVSACSSGSAGSAGSSGASDSSAASAGTVATEARPAADVDTLKKLPARVDGGVITVGDPKAPHTVKVYEDARCPFCKKFEEGGARALAAPAAKGEVKIEYTIASFLDNNLGGSGSVKAANALRASVEAGRFAEYHAAVYANQPDDETDDVYTDAFLLKIADTVDGLRGATFDRAVKDTSYKKWVDTAMESFRDDGVQATPTVRVDGEKPGGEGDMYGEASFAKVLAAAGIS
ncbi:DsbA family protein [Streptomyces beihaiensis]|uniref:DsbA family protein n=1 Tax=Streptomyces beihaiensis TaxID=2984495 RepID=A0ABT3TX12_9ACTN|nr:thioredoxin domain-containing protein [Streptomyces beihaiensis]MCX3061583.1 DsbA family protein [Streptomyces beihaiensis]